MITKSKEHRAIDTLLLKSYKEYDKALMVRDNMFYNLEVMNIQFNNMTDRVKTMYSNIITYDNRIAALKDAIYNQVYKLYEAAMLLIEKYNALMKEAENIDAEILELYNIYVEKTAATAAALATYNASQVAYDAWFENTYVPQYNYAYQQWVAAVNALNNTRFARQSYIETYNGSYFKSNWQAVNAFKDFIEGRDPTGTHWTLRMRLENTVLSPGDGPYDTFWDNVYNNYGTEDNPRWTYRTYKIQYGRSALDEDGLSAFYVHLYWYYQDDPTNEFDGMFYYGFDIEGTNPIHVPADDVDLLLTRAKRWMDDNETYQADLTAWNANHALYEQTVANYDTQIAAWDSLADQWQDTMIDLNTQKSNLEQVVSDNYQAWKTASAEQGEAALNWVQKIAYKNQLTFLILDAFNKAYIASGTYNVTKSNAQSSQKKSKGAATFYPSLPEPWNMVVWYTTDTDVPEDADKPAYNPDIPEPEEEEDYSQTQE